MQTFVFHLTEKNKMFRDKAESNILKKNVLPFKSHCTNMSRNRKIQTLETAA